MTTATANTLDIDLVRAALTPDYEIIAELGRGGMATVYRAREVQLEREVAIKVLPAMLAMDAEFVERFQNEARVAGRLEHPHIVPIYRVGRSGTVIYFVMKLLRGQSLSAVLRQRKKLEAGEIRRILIETAGALGYAAKRSVVHRDIKPDNLLLDSEGRCVITDFGIAKTPGGRQTAAGTSLGTPRYMSPEHAQGVPLDGRSDMYSLGVVAYQCLAGKTPFDSDDPFAVLYKHINEPLPVPTLDTEEEREIYAVIERMLAKRPEDRFQSADELIAALGVEIDAPTLVSATLPATPGLMMPTQLITTRVASLARKVSIGIRDKRTWAAAGVVVLLAAGGTLVALTRDAESPPSEAATTTARPIELLPTMMTPLVVVAERPAPPPRAAFSRCPRSPGGLSVMVDSVGAQKPGSAFTMVYDVCGLDNGTAYSMDVTLRKITSRLSRAFGRAQEPVTITVPEIATSSRMRRRRDVSLSGLSSGTYALEVKVVDRRRREASTRTEFEILDK